MDHTRSLRVTIAPTACARALLGAPAAATAQTPPGPVDESKLVPSLSPTFVPWTC